MKKDAFKRKEFFHGFKQIPGEQWLLEKMSQIIVDGKQAFDVLSLELGRMLAETIMYMEREELAGPDYMPISPEVRKWASQGGSVYVGEQKLKLSRPRLRGPEGEIALKSYQKLKMPHKFSHELLAKVLRGLSGRRYHETVTDAAKSFGVSASSVSLPFQPFQDLRDLRHIVEATVEKLKVFKERSLSTHRLGVPELLRKTLKSTNPIESMLRKVRHCEKNIKRYRGSNMAQRWLGAVLLHAEERFHKVEGHKHILEVLVTMKTLLTESLERKIAA